MRRLFNISTILSLLLLMATAALWVASGSVQKWAYTPDSGSATRMVVCSHGTLTVAQCGAPPAMAHWRVGSGGRSTGLIIYLVMPPPGFLKDRALLGIDVVRASNGWILPPDQVNQKDNLDPSSPILAITISFWLLVILLSLLPTLYVAYWLRKHIWTNGDLCACGYNLTGNVSGICPECGSKIATR